MNKDFSLTDKQRVSPEWQRVKEIITARVEKHRIALEADKSPEETQKLRGRLAELKDLLKLDKEPPQAPDE